MSLIVDLNSFFGKRSALPLGKNTKLPNVTMEHAESISFSNWFSDKLPSTRQKNALFPLDWNHFSKKYFYDDTLKNLHEVEIFPVGIWVYHGNSAGKKWKIYRFQEWFFSLKHKPSYHYQLLSNRNQIPCRATRTKTNNSLYLTSFLYQHSTGQYDLLPIIDGVVKSFIFETRKKCIILPY